MTSLPDELTIQDVFPPATWDDWRELAEAALNGAPFERRLVRSTDDGIALQPLYMRKDAEPGADPLGYPGQPPYVRGSDAAGAVRNGWDLRPEYSDPDPVAANQAILSDLEGGATSLVLKLDGAAAWGLDPDDPQAAERVGRGGVMLFSADDLRRVLAGVHLSMVHVSLDAGAAFLPAAGCLIHQWQTDGIPDSEARGAFNADPLGTLARHGALPVSESAALRQLADLAQWTAQRLPLVTAVGVDSAPWHDAGATPAQDIACAVATGVEYLRAMTDAGLSAAAAAGQIRFRLCLGTRQFQAIAKLRAARWVWSRVLQACGSAEPAPPMRIHARIGDRVLTQRDPHVNILRNAVVVFAAGVGGADAITSVPFDSLVRLPDAFSRRVARNTVLVLQEESHLHRVIDPAGGSWFLDRLTRQLAEKAWEEFQDIERHGGMRAVLHSGRMAERVAAARAARDKAVATRKTGITGVSEFPDLSQQPLAPNHPDPGSLREAAAQRIRAVRSADAVDAIPADGGQTESVVAAVTQGASMGQLARALGLAGEAVATVPKVEPHRLAAPFEALRDASDRYLAATGRRPQVFQANMGPIAHHTARATWSRNFFEAGGFEVIGNDGFADAEAAAAAFSESQADLAVICSSDRLYPDVVPATAKALKARGASSVVLAGPPGEHEAEWRDAGVDRFIFLKCDVLQTLRELLSGLGVLPAGETAR